MKTIGWDHVTPYLVFCVVAYAWGDLLFGVDTGSFGSLQALPSWLSQFGQFNAKTKAYAIPTYQASVMNSVVFGGKLIGTAAFEPLAERLGYKITMYVVCVIQCIGLIVELTAKNWAVFTVGRIIAYLAVGIVENAVPSYISEISPASVRGFMSGTMTVLVTGGNHWGTGMSRAFATVTSKRGWMIPTAVQFVPAMGTLFLVPFTPESPRWLVLKGRSQEALKSLNAVRPRGDVDSGVTSFEVAAFEQAVEETRTRHEGSWLDLARGTFRRRAIITALLFWFYETTGLQFVNTYGPTFYKQIGACISLALPVVEYVSQWCANTFNYTYTVIGTAMAVIATIVAIVATDRVGRRIPVIVGSCGLIIFNFLIAGLGSAKHKTAAGNHAVIASIILLLVSAKMFQTVAFLNASEIGGPTMRKKFMAFGTSVDVISAFIVTFCLPYILKTPGANLGPKVRWILGGDSVFALIFSVFFFPDITARSLEEMDELFGMRLWAWQFSTAETQGVGRRIAELEAGQVVQKAENDSHVQHFAEKNEEAGQVV